MSTKLWTYPTISSLQLAEPGTAHVDWLWQGYLARGATSLLTSQWKTGKTTLVSVLLKRLAVGGELAGLAVNMAKVAVVSEERLENWRRRHERLQFADNLTFLCRPFSKRPTYEMWTALIEQLAQMGETEGIELVVIDPLSQFLPGPAENQSNSILEALQPFERLTAAGQSVLLVHHPRKQAAAPGMTARGSGALSAAVDVLVEMKVPPGSQSQDRRRKLLAWSRYDDTPRERLIELSADGTDYSECQIETADEGEANYVAIVEHLLTCPPRKLSRLQLLSDWPKRLAAPHPVVLWRALDSAVKSGKFEQEGTGRKSDPLRYFIPGLDAAWRPDPRELFDFLS